MRFATAVTALLLVVAAPVAGRQSARWGHPVQPGLRTVLAPARIPPVSNECIRTVRRGADGNVQPLLCAGGGVNVNAWRHYARGWVGHPPLVWSRTMALGKHPAANDVFDAMCVDLARVYGTVPLTRSAEALAAAYYGWHFSAGNPARELGTRACPKLVRAPRAA